VGLWSLITLEPCDANDALYDIDNWTIAICKGGDTLAADLQVGDNFLVKIEDGNVEKVEFYVL
jgi:hypothetical protein